MLMTGAPTRTIRLPYPHPGQIGVRQSAKRFNYLSAGRRWRKTTLLMSIMVEAAAKGGTYVWGAPTFDQVRIGFDEMRKAAGAVADFNISRMTVTFPGGGRVIFRSLDNPDNARGFTADGVGIDEAADVKPNAWYEVLRPMLIDTNGWAWMIGTPKGLNWFWQESQNARERDDSAAWQIPSLGVEIAGNKLIRRPHPLENPFIPFDEIERVFESSTQLHFRQEILAQFVDDENSVFRNVGECVADCGRDTPETGHTYVMGVDWGKLNDFTVLTVLDITNNKVVKIDRFNKIDYNFQLRRLRSLYDVFKPYVIVAESNSMGETLIDRLHEANLPVMAFNTNNKSKDALIQALAIAFERGHITIPDDPQLIGELRAYEAKRLDSGVMKYSAPDGMHDDMVMSLALAWKQASASSGMVLW